MNYSLGLALLLSILLHGIVILGMGQWNLLPLPRPTPSPLLEVVLVPIQQQQSPEKPDFLAQANVVGGHKKEPEHPPPPPPRSPSLSKSPSASPATPLLTPSAGEKPPAPKPIATPPVLTQKQSSRLVSDPQPAPQPAPLEAVETDPPEPRPSARELIAALEGQLAREAQRYANQPRKRYIDSSTKEYAATAYLDAWRKKIERVGKMNYPEEAKRQGLSGSLILVVDLNADGTVADIVIRRSSGYQILDQAAIRIVHLAAPFAKVPEDVLQNHDRLSITRTWQFHSGKGFSSN